MTQTLSIFGIGAFGEFIIPYLTPYFHVRVYDAYRDLSDIDTNYAVDLCDFEMAMQSDILIVAVPIQNIETLIEDMKPYLQAGQLVIDVGSVKCKPIEIIAPQLPVGVDYVATHPIFGPQSGKNGIEGQNISVVNVKGTRGVGVVDFLRHTLKLNVIESSAEEHDQQMAYVQGLTHMIAKIFKTMNVPTITQQSRTYDHLESMVNLIKNDSDDLFKAIQTDNPYVEEVKTQFFETVKVLESQLQVKN